jgi:hypothetical protein
MIQEDYLLSFRCSVLNSLLMYMVFMFREANAVECYLQLCLLMNGEPYVEKQGQIRL